MDFIENEVLLQFQGFLESPAMWENENYFPYPQFFIDNNSEAKRATIISEIPTNIALGRRAEYFFRFFIDHFSEAEILAFNEQVISNKITLGELDFLLKEKNSRKILHVELVYKFYIYDPSFKTEKDRWIGPNRRDTLVKKLEKMEQKQFPLLYKQETKPLLKNLNILAEEIEQKICFKALLFLPKHFQNQKIPDINNECIKGYWIKFADFTAEEYQNYQFYAPEKQNWPINPKFCNKWYSFKEIKAQILQIFENKKSPLIWMKKNDDEFERFFVIWW